MKEKMRLHLVQCATVAGRPLATLAKLQALLEDLRSRPGDVWVFPEMWPSGFSLTERRRLAEENAVCREWLRNFARRARGTLIGSMLELARGRAYNQAYAIGPRGETLAAYRKIHLFEFGGEHRHFSPGRRVVSFPSPWGRIGLAVCYDLRFPELFRRLSKAGVRLVFVPSAWPRDRLDHFLALLKARAIENQCLVVGLNKVGPGRHEKPVVYGGHSAVFGPWGEKLAEMGARPAVLSLELDLGAVERVRRRYPFLKSRVLG